MIYKNIEIHNVKELIECENGGVTWMRVPQNVYDNLETGEQSARMAVNSTGVELRFVMKSDEVKIRMQSLGTPTSVTNFNVFRGDIQGGWEDHESGRYITTGELDYVIKKPENMELLRSVSKDSGTEWDPEVVRVIFNRGNFRIIDVTGDVEPPSKEQKPSKTLFAYGSSITHGSNSLCASNNWVSLVAHNLDMDFRNLGMAGSCAMEPEMIDFIASEGEAGLWDVALLELGINVLGWENEKITERVTNTIVNIAGRNKDKKIVVISPFYCCDDYKNGGLAEKWRDMIEKIVKDLAFENVTYINGLDLLGSMTLISADEVHPNIYGVAQIAERLYDRIKDICK